MSPLRRLASVLLLLGILVPQASATWSIVVVDRRTGEVCIASATCIPRIDLSAVTPVILVGVGGGVTQAVLDDGGNKVRIWEGFLAGDTPREILDRIRAEDPGVATRQFGIVDLVHEPLSFTGRQAGPAKKSVTGSVGDLVYAIQGNVLVHDRVVDECEATLRSAPGDLGQRVMAAMVRARELGGDGRCSCGLGSLGDCGQPAPDFEKSAHTGFVILARPGDGDGSCSVGASCADGEYTLRLVVRGADALHESPDPVDQLVERYALWRAERSGRPDGVLSRVQAVDSLPADGMTERTVTVTLVDLDGQALTHGGAALEVAMEDGGPSLVSVGAVSDHGDGSYSFPLRAGLRTGVDRLVIRASDELVRATLVPALVVRSDPPGLLHVGLDHLSAAAPEPVPIVVDAPRHARGKYWLFARLDGGSARRHFDPHLPHLFLPDRAPYFPGPPGLLDAHGRAEELTALPPGALVPWVGRRLEWSARVFGHGRPEDAPPVGLTIVP